MRRIVSGFAYVVVAALTAAAGCGNSQELVVVSVHGTRANAAALEVLVTIDGQQAMHLERFGADVTDFGLALPDGARGALAVSVAGVDGNNCIVSFDSTNTQVSGAGRIDLTVTLGPISPPQCGT
jgi:hypothetical protein